MARKSYEEAFWEKVDQRGPNECWLWTAGTTTSALPNAKPYGYFRGQRAHRVAYKLDTGEDPGYGIIMHTCDTPLCVNPAHLELGTSKENCLDKDAKGRRTLKKKCWYGHEYGEDNFWYNQFGHRQCRTCKPHVPPRGFDPRNP